MSRRSPRVRVRFVATVQIAGVDHTLICHTRDISVDGCFLDTAEIIAPGVGVALSVMDNERGEVVTVEGHITRSVDGEERGIGVRLIHPPDGWHALVDRYQNATSLSRPSMRLTVLVVSAEANRRGALALYVTSGWDIRFAVDAATASEALGGIALDAVIAEFEASDDTWRQIMSAAQSKQPSARRLVRCRTEGIDLPPSGVNELAHRFVEVEHGMDSLLDALTAELGAEALGEEDPMTGAVSLSDTDSRKILRELIEVIQADDRSIAVFDLDSTLLYNAPRQSAILREYGTLHGLADLQKSKPEHWSSWDVADAMRNSGLDDALVQEHRNAFKTYWRERFFTSKYCVLDEAIAGASEFVQAVRDVGGRVYYVTGRHEEMRRGTVECLRRLGFPIPDDRDVKLVMKPSLDEDDDDFKDRTYAILNDEGRVVGAFDNEPTHINGYRENFPDALSIHLATDHSGREVRLLDGIVSIRNFEAFALPGDE